MGSNDEPEQLDQEGDFVTSDDTDTDNEKEAEHLGEKYSSEESGADNGTMSEPAGEGQQVEGIARESAPESQFDLDLSEYGYEEAAPEVQRRNRRRSSTYRRNSLLDRIMTWAGVVNDEQFYQNHSQEGGPRQVPAVGTSRRASMDGAMTGARQMHLPQARPRFPSSDDIVFMDQEGEYDHCDEGKYYGGDDDDAAEYHDRDNMVPRRNSLHAMVERAMAYVNMTKRDDDNDLTPFGNRRDSLFG